MTYMGYTIASENGHVRVTAPSGATWTEDTVNDACESIAQEMEPIITLRDRLRLMDQIELGNRQRINEYIKSIAH